jgi:hypothetical protein
MAKGHVGGSRCRTMLIAVLGAFGEKFWIGAFNRAENAEGALWMINQVMPLVVVEHPTARLVLASAGPGPDLYKYQGPGVYLTGFVNDLGPYYRAAHCCVSPIFSGGGFTIQGPSSA